MAKKEKPGRLPGMTEYVDKELDEKFDELLSKERSKNKARLAYGECHLQLIDLMKKKKVNHYRHEESGQIWQIEATEKIKHKNLKEQERGDINPDGDEDEDEDEDLDIKGQSAVIDGLQEIADEGDDDDPRPQRLKNKEAADKAKTINGKANELPPPAPTSKLAGYKRTVPT